MDRSSKKQNYSNPVLQRLFKKAGASIESAIDQRAIKDGQTREDYNRIDQEAQRVAKAAVAALHRASAAKPKLKAKVQSGSKSSSALERIRARRAVTDEIAAPLSSAKSEIDPFKKSKLNPNDRLARELRDFLAKHRNGVKTEALVAKFDGNVKSNAVFKAVLKQIATLNKDTHRWKLREQFRK